MYSFWPDALSASRAHEWDKAHSPPKPNAVRTNKTRESVVRGDIGRGLSTVSVPGREYGQGAYPVRPASPHSGDSTEKPLLAIVFAAGKKRLPNVAAQGDGYPLPLAYRSIYRQAALHVPAERES